MTKSERAKIVLEDLRKFCPNPQVPLNHTDTYSFLIAVLLSAQCTDKRVNEVTPKLFAAADTPQKMAALDVEKIQSIIRPCGLSPTKAKNIKALSQILCQKYDGQVPHTFEELEALPGVGHKTASVIMQQAFGQDAFPVDTHIHRLATRWRLSDGSSVEQTERDLKKLFPPSEWRNLHLQMIYYGREHCKAHTCKTPETYCPMCQKLAKK